MTTSDQSKQRSLRALEWLNFFLADVQTGLGPFVAAYLASSGWNPGSVGYALTFGGLVTVAIQTPAGAVVDAARRKRLLVLMSLSVLVAGAFLLMARPSVLSIYSAQLLIGGAAPFLLPTVAAITLGIVGAKAFDSQFGKNQAFNSAGNVFTALLVAYVSYKFGYRTIFIVAALLAIPAAFSAIGIDAKQIDYACARGGRTGDKEFKAEGLQALLKDHVLVFFLLAAFLFHLGNAAMLPQLGEMLSKGNPKAAAPFMSACIVVTQLVIAISAVFDWQACWNQRTKAASSPGIRSASDPRRIVHADTHGRSLDCDPNPRRRGQRGLRNRLDSGHQRPYRRNRKIQSSGGRTGDGGRHRGGAQHNGRRHSHKARELQGFVSGIGGNCCGRVWPSLVVRSRNLGRP